MFRSLRLQRFVARIALFAVMMAALAPTISHALVAAGMDEAWTEICSAGGTRWVKLGAEYQPDRPDAPRPVQHADPFVHCPFCVNPAGSAGLLPPPRQLVTSPPGKTPAPAHFPASPRSQQAWGAALARAPPAAG